MTQIVFKEVLNTVFTVGSETGKIYSQISYCAQHDFIAVEWLKVSFFSEGPGKNFKFLIHVNPKLSPNYLICNTNKTLVFFVDKSY